MPKLNYATEYSRELSQNFPYVLNFGKLYATPNNNRYRWVNAKSIEIPSISTTGRVKADRDTIAHAQRNYDNAWELKTLTNERKWSTLVHPMDVDQTNLVTTIGNITQVFNEEQKFPEMDAYTISKIYADWIAAKDPNTAQLHAPLTESSDPLSKSTILSVFDKMMLKMDNDRVPANGRILYCTFEVKQMLKEATDFYRTMDVQSANQSIQRTISRIEEVEVIGVPATLMQTAYDFTQGWAVDSSATQINMFLVHPTAVITPVSYTYAQLDAPSAGSEGKYVYYEEAFEDVFILNNKSNAIYFHTA